MTIDRQRIHLLLATTAVAFGFAVGPVAAQGSYPSKTVLMIVPAAAGGTTDLAGRMAAQALAPVIGQSVVVDNKSGGNGSRLCENAWLTTLQKLKSQHPFSAR